MRSDEGGEKKIFGDGWMEGGIIGGGWMDWDGDYWRWLIGGRRRRLLEVVGWRGGIIGGGWMDGGGDIGGG